MQCEKCIWGQVVSDYQGEQGRKTTIMCSRINCPQIAEFVMEGEKAMLKKPLIYVCSPLKDNMKQNIKKAQQYCRFVAECHAIPIAPHLYFTQFLDDASTEERLLGLKLGISILPRCSAIWVFGDKISSGMRHELDSARKLKIPVFFYDKDCQPSQEPITGES
jgi:hypothetical protein